MLSPIKILTKFFTKTTNNILKDIKLSISHNVFKQGQFCNVRSIDDVILNDVRDSRIRFNKEIQGFGHDDQGKISDFKKINKIQINNNRVIEVPSFPQTKQDLNKIGNKLHISNQKVNQDHRNNPNYTDKQYIMRKSLIAQKSKNYKLGDPIPTVDYLPEQQQLWQNIYKKLSILHKQVMTDHYLYQLSKMEKLFNISKRIPQLCQLNQYVKSQTSFQLKPCIGTISQREYLNCLAFKVFTCTQFLRHPANPEYSPEPDIVHEILGHIVMLSDPKYAEINQLMGLQSLGASDQQVSQIGSLYMYTIQFGVIQKQGEKRKCYGAGLAGCVAEMEHFLSQKSKFRPLDPVIDSKQDLIFHNVQPVYKTSPSLEDAIMKIKSFGKNMEKPFSTIYSKQKVKIESQLQIQVDSHSNKALNIY